MRALSGLRSPWPYVSLSVVAAALAVAYAPVAAAFVVSGAFLASFLVWRFGIFYGLWYLALVALPLRQPLSLDVHGTVSVCLVDVLLFVLLGAVLVRSGVRKLWARSATFKILALILFLSAAGLYSATRVFWGVASVYRLLVQLAVFVVAVHLVRDERDALRSLIAVVAGLVVPVAYGFYQASLPFGAPVPDWGYVTTAYDLTGAPFLRVFSTMNHPLNFSHYLTTGIGLCLGMAVGAAGRRLSAILVSIAAVTAFMNLFTYSAGGLLGMAVTIAVLVVLARSARLTWFVLFLAAVLVVTAPPALVAKIDRLVTGQSVATAARLVTYQQSFMILRDHPLLGVGWGGIRGALEGAYRLTRADPVAFGAENYFLQRAIALGLVGLFLYVALLWKYVRNVREMGGLERERGGWRPVRMGVVAATFGFFVQAQFIPTANVSTNSVLWLLLAIADVAGAGGVPSPRRPG